MIQDIQYKRGSFPGGHLYGGVRPHNWEIDLIDKQKQTHSQTMYKKHEPKWTKLRVLFNVTKTTHSQVELLKL